MLLPRLALVLCLACSAIAQTPVTIDATAAASSTRIPPRFLGLSFETSSLTSTTGFPAENPVFQKMVSQLGPGVLRLGGNSDDQTLWAPGPRVSSDPKTILRTTDVDRLFSFAAAIGWNVLWSVNLGTGTPDQAADEAGYVQTTYAPLLLGFEIGNEPDLYYKNGLRTSTYTENNYFTEWKAFADAIQLKAPAAVLTGSAASGSYATWTAAFATQYGSRIALLTQHEYVTGPLASVAATASNSATIPHLLGTAIHAAADTEAAGLTQIAKKAGLPWRMAEANSCYNGGQTGVSNAFASALWGVDWMFTLAADGSTGVNFHGGGSGTYTPIAATVSGSTVTMSARPLYYALLLFQAAARGRIVPVNVQAGAVNLTSYAALDDDGSRRVIVINKDAALDAAVRISVGPQYQTASVLRLSAPALDAATGVTLGGSTVQPDGSWSPATTETLAVNAGAASATVPAGSAALFLFSPGNVAVANAAGGQPVVAPESLATAYGEGLAFVQQSATQTPLPTTLAAAQVTIQDANGVTQQAPLLYVSPSQVNFQVPAGAASGPASITLAGSTGTAQIALAAPGLFTLGSTKVAAAQAFRQPNGTATLLPLPASDCTTGTCVTVPLSLDANSTVFVSLYATGLRHATAPVTCTVGGTPVPALYAGAQGTFIGLDQINLSLPVTLRGLGETGVACSANGLTSNAVRINVGG